MSSTQIVLVSGIGGVVGQGILGNLKKMSNQFRLIGTNTVPVSAGNHLCEAMYQVPYAYEAKYISSIKKIIDREKVNLIIPSTDYESFYLSKFKDQFTAKVAASPFEVVQFCIDKYKNYQKFYEKEIPFASSCLPETYNGQYDGILVKPREGRGSRQIHVNPEDITQFDTNFVVQEFLDGPEITCTFYVTKKRELHGFITFRRELENGNTSKCEVTDDYDEQLFAIINKIITHFPFRGSCNIQARVTKHGVIPFEINCRISGTNSVRSQFGFEDVKYTIQEHLLNEEPDAPDVKKGAALRIIRDIIYPGKKLQDIRDKKDEFYIN